ncbi:MAG: hypothetical protein JO356_01130 [Acidobacteria bacterium]|nr:hypothetical protein [Acidobacteriota bacterium]
MTDVLTAPEQDAIAESLLGDQSQDPSAQDYGAEEGVEVQGEIDQQQSDPQQQLESDETADEYQLPTDQQKVFPDEVLLQYAEQRYPDILRLLENDPTNGTLKQLLHDKLNTDIYLQSLEQQEQEFDQSQEYEDESQAEPTQQATQPQLTREQWFQTLDRAITERTDPEIAKAFHSDFLRSFGVPEAEIAKIPPQQAQQFTAVASKYMLNLVSTFLPEMLSAQMSQQIAQLYPGFGEMYERSAYAMAWDRVRNQNPQYQSLPAYGSKEFSKALRDAAAQIPGFDEMQFTGRDGKPLSMMENASRKYSMLAQIASGQAVDPRLVRQAAEAGARAARRADVRRQGANLGSGQSRAASGRQNSSRFQTNSDLFDDEAMGRYQQEHGRL